MTKFARNAARLATLGVLAGFGLLATGGAGHAVVYCKTVGYPKGCVARAGPWSCGRLRAPSWFRRVVSSTAPASAIPSAAWCVDRTFARNCA
ncbi:hypothetical protein EZH22_20425 [Xanthobacter dioxanivorans]|uniref:Uncharacterized protein n=1 Tax=Xanthobacter dioxanivorans TaxID=2528964 RepID=A0A974PKY0_9HYPH|nr:hypothetical protein [Xanthobacter dioxanivorans]QRG05429.1 hypothetical protein EZH22_20425 [Xanthobacter dioxanivorans]